MSSGPGRRAPVVMFPPVPPLGPTEDRQHEAVHIPNPVPNVVGLEQFAFSALHTCRVPTFDLPLTIRGPDGDVEVTVAVPERAVLGHALPALLRAAGLPAGTVLNIGVGPAEGSWPLGRAPLLAGTVLSTRPSPRQPDLGAVNVSCIAGPDSGRWVPFENKPIEVGRGPGADLCLDDPELSRSHVRFVAHKGAVVGIDLGSTNGIRVDGVVAARPPPESADRTSGRGYRPWRRSYAARPGPAAAPNRVEIPPGSVVRVGGSVLRWGLDAEPPAVVRPDGRGRLLVARAARVDQHFDAHLGERIGPVPERSRNPLPILAALIGGVAGGVIAVVTGTWMFLMLAALGPLLMLTTGVSDRVSGRRSHRRTVAEHRRSLAAQGVAFDSAIAADRADAWERYPDPAALLRRTQNLTSRLWERRRGGPDFLRLSLGVGTRAVRTAIRDPPEVTEVPVTVDLPAFGVVGLTGDARPLLRNLIAQIASLHSPADLRLLVFSTASELLQLRDLPHATAGGGAGLVARTEVEAADEVRILLAATATGGRPDRVTVLILDDAYRWRRVPGMHELLRGAAGSADGAGDSAVPAGGRFLLGPASGALVALCIADSAEELPAECTAVMDVRAGRVRLSAVGEGADAEVAGVRPEYLQQLVRALAPLVDPDTPGGGIPVTVNLADISPQLSRAVGPGSAGQFGLGLEERWATPSLTATIGLSTAGPMTVDIERDGPHLLIAGTTGSGKSELLRTLVASLAMAAPPTHTSFLLIDYKGGAAFRGLSELPHAVGTVTDLDGGLAARALTSLQAEVRRRERIFAGHGVEDLAGLRRKYSATACVESDPTLAAPPSLIIVVDEFATLSAELPDFLPGLLDVAQRGRSLGLHLVLATQRPAGVLSPAIKSNITLRICLRVTDDADSLDILESTLASRLPPIPGRALLRVAGAAPVLFQTATVSSSGRTALSVRLRDQPCPPVAADDPGTARNSLLQDLADQAETTFGTGSRPTPPWVPALPTVFGGPVPAWGSSGDNRVHTAAFAMQDRPDDQCTAEIAAPSGSIVVCGPSGSGRTNTLRRLARLAAAAGSTVVVLDAGGGLAGLAKWPQTATYLDTGHPELLQRAVALVAAECRRRSGAGGGGGGSAGHGGKAGRNRSSGGDCGDVLLILDGWESIAAGLEAVDYGSSVTLIGEIAARGPINGISVAAAGELRLLHHRVVAAFPNRVVLGCNPRAEPESGMPPGRGRLDGFLIQVAWDPPGQEGAVVRSSTAEQSGGGRLVVRPLPLTVERTTLPRIGPGFVAIGLGGDGADPVGLDLTGPGGGFLVAGPRRSGVSTALTTLAAGAAGAGIPTFTVLVRSGGGVPVADLAARDFAASDPAASDPAASDPAASDPAASDPAADPAPGGLAPGELAAGRPGGGLPMEIDVHADCLALQEMLAAHRGPLLLIADDAHAWPEHAAQLFERFLAVAGAGQYLAVGSRMDYAIRSQRGAVAEAAAFRTGVLLQADGSDGALLDAALPRVRGHRVPGRGHLVLGGTVKSVQIAF